MKIYSWNMLFRNQEQDRAFAFIRDADFDVFCLQEVPGAFLNRLKELGLHLSYRIDGHRALENQDIYTVVLSRHPIAEEGGICFQDTPRSARVRAFVWLMRPFHFTAVTNRNAVFADIRMPGHEKPIRVFSLHLSLSLPARRAAEFAAAMRERNPAQPTLVCGDFNILESPKVTLLNWLLGGHLRDIFFWISERQLIESFFAENDLSNPLRGRITHPFSRSQLDHILVPSAWKVTSAKVIPDSHGSDHNPIAVDAELSMQ